MALPGVGDPSGRRNGGEEVRNYPLDLLDCIWGLQAPLEPRAVPTWASLNGIWCWWGWYQAASAVLPPPLHLQDSAASGIADQGSSGVWKRRRSSCFNLNYSKVWQLCGPSSGNGNLLFRHLGVVCVAEVTARAIPCQQNHGSDTTQKDTGAAAAEPTA